jgi:hypothetical protein
VGWTYILCDLESFSPFSPPFHTVVERNSINFSSSVLWWLEKKFFSLLFICRPFLISKFISHSFGSFFTLKTRDRDRSAHKLLSPKLFCVLESHKYQIYGNRWHGLSVLYFRCRRRNEAARISSVFCQLWQTLTSIRRLLSAKVGFMNSPWRGISDQLWPFCFQKFTSDTARQPTCFSFLLRQTTICFPSHTQCFFPVPIASEIISL